MKVRLGRSIVFANEFEEAGELDVDALFQVQVFFSGVLYRLLVDTDQGDEVWYPRNEFISQLDMALLVALAEDVVEAVAECCCVVPVRPRIRRAHGADFANNVRIVGDKVVWTDSCEVAYCIYINTLIH